MELTVFWVGRDVSSIPKSLDNCLLTLCAFACAVPALENLLLQWAAADTEAATSQSAGSKCPWGVKS